jgi:hypothetical protein
MLQHQQRRIVAVPPVHPGGPAADHLCIHIDAAGVDAPDRPAIAVIP